MVSEKVFAGRERHTSADDPGHSPSSPTASTLDREQSPLACHTLEAVLAASGKTQARPGDQIDDDARDQHLARRSRSRHTRGDVDRDAADVVVAQLDLARVYACPHLEAQAPQHVADRHGTPDRAGRSIEPGEEAVACRVDLTAVEACELAPDLGVVPAEQLLPSLVAKLDRALRGVDGVGRKSGGQDAP